MPKLENPKNQTYKVLLADKTNNKIENAFKLSFETEGEKSEEKKEVFDKSVE